MTRNRLKKEQLIKMLERRNYQYGELLEDNIKLKKEIEICKNCGHTYGWHNDLGFCCKCSSFNKPCWENKNNDR